MSVVASSTDHDDDDDPFSLSSTVTTPTPSSMDLVANDAPSPAQQQRQSILGNFLRVRPRGSSQSHQGPPQLAPHDNTNGDHQGPVSNNSNNMPAQPPSPGPNPGHRRRPAANGLQASVSHGFNLPSSNSTSGSVFPQLLRRRRSANGVIVAPNMAPPAANPVPPRPAADRRASPAAANASSQPTRTHRIRLVPHLDTNRSLHFDAITRDVGEGVPALRIGRFTDRSGLGIAALNAQTAISSRSRAKSSVAPTQRSGATKLASLDKGHQELVRHLLEQFPPLPAQPGVSPSRAQRRRCPPTRCRLSRRHR